MANLFQRPFQPLFQPLFQHPTVGKGGGGLFGAGTPAGAVLGNAPVGMAVDFKNNSALVRGHTPEFSGTATDFFTVTRASSATLWNAAGILESVAAGLMRFDHDPVTRERLGVLIEGQRTNLLLRSQEFDNASWSKISGTTITANIALAPDGTMTADRVVNLNAAAGDRVVQVVSASPSTAYTGSIWVKGEGSDIGKKVQVTVKRAGTGAYSGQTADIVLTAFWQRVNLTFTMGADNVSAGLFIGSGVDSATDVLIWGAQLEAGPMPSSHIPTGASQVTRAADNITLARSAIPYDDTQVSIMVEANWDYGSALSSSVRYAFQIDAGSDNNRILVSNRNGTAAGVAVVSAGVTETAQNGVAGTSAFVRSALRLVLNDFRLVSNGSLVGVDNAVVMPAPPTMLRFGGHSPLYGHIKRVVIVPRLWSDAELTAMSTP